MRHLFTEKCSRYGMLILGILMLASEIWKQYTLTRVFGRFEVWYFPFQLCSLPMYLCILQAFLPARERSRIRVFLMTFTLLGSLAVFLDTTGMHYPLTSLTIHSYLWHLLLILIGLWSGLTWCRDPEPMNFRSGLPLWGVSILIAELLNYLLKSMGEINMFYISLWADSQQPVVRQMILLLKESISPLLARGVTAVLYLAAMWMAAGLLYLGWTHVRESLPSEDRI